IDTCTVTEELQGIGAGTTIDEVAERKSRAGSNQTQESVISGSGSRIVLASSEREGVAGVHQTTQLINTRISGGVVDNASERGDAGVVGVSAAQVAGDFRLGEFERDLDAGFDDFLDL